jgi:hypothetical protein
MVMLLKNRLVACSQDDPLRSKTACTGIQIHKDNTGCPESQSEKRKKTAGKRDFHVPMQAVRDGPGFLLLHIRLTDFSDNSAERLFLPKKTHPTPFFSGNYIESVLISACFECILYRFTETTQPTIPINPKP